MLSFRKIKRCFVYSKIMHRDNEMIFIFPFLLNLKIIKSFEIIQDNRVSSEFEVENNFDKEEFASLTVNFKSSAKFF